ncbi:MAG TPA: hypothetical protein VGQ62_05985 [Chloroflexota bacterium]|nr:hypothetical protein [Chloroflexota bacterium]
MRWLPSVVLVLPLLFGSLSPSTDVRLRDLAGPVSFRLLDWETLHLADSAGRLWLGLTSANTATNADGDLLREYFATPVAARAGLHATAEGALEREVGQAYRGAGLTQSPPLA